MGAGDLQQRDFRSGPPTRRTETVSLSRVLGEGEDLLTWSLPVFTSRALHVRLHFVFLLMAVWEIILSASRVHAGPTHVLNAMAAVVVLVIARELGRWYLSRWAGGRPDQIVLWPLGLLSATGLARQGPPSVGAALGGLAVNLVLAPVLAGSLWMAGQGWDALVFNPLSPLAVVGHIGSLAVAVLWWAYYVNLILLGTNLLVPMFPLDAGRALEALLARRVGARRASMVACRIGLLTGLVLLVAAMSADQSRLMGLAVLGFGACWIHLRRAEFLHDAGPLQDTPEASRTSSQQSASISAVPPTMPDAPPPDQSSAAHDAAEIDRILEKISTAGLAALTADESRTLAAATERRRNSRAGRTNNR